MKSAARPRPVSWPTPRIWKSCVRQPTMRFSPDSPSWVATADELIAPTKTSSATFFSRLPSRKRWKVKLAPISGPTGAAIRYQQPPGIKSPLYGTRRPSHASWPSRRCCASNGFCGVAGAWFDCHSRLLHRHALGQVARLVDVAAAQQGDVIRQQLQRHDAHQRLQELRARAARR